MGRAKNIFYFNSDKSLFVKTNGNSFLGVFNKDDEYVGVIKNKCGDMFKWVFNNEVFIIRWFKRKGYCVFYKISNNDLNLEEAEMWFVPGSKPIKYSWWEGCEGFEEFNSLFDLEDDKKD